jgi:hypothetical protein
MRRREFISLVGGACSIKFELIPTFPAKSLNHKLRR